MKRRNTVLSLALALSLTMALAACGSNGSESSSSSASTEKYPSEAITMIVNYSAGGGTDLAARSLGDAASSILGQPITVTNVTGGSGTVGVTELANSKNDGYTMGVATLSPLALMPWQLEVTYAPEDFEYICAFGQYGYGIVVSADSEIQTLDDLLAMAKDAPITYGCTGYPQPFTMDELAAAAGAQFDMVSYSSTTDLITDVLGGFIPVAMCDQASFTSYVENGQMRLLASATDKRWDLASDVPTLQELGYDIVCDSYMGLCVPADTDEAIVEALRDAFKQASEDADYKDILRNCNLTWAYLSGQDYEQLVTEKYAEYKALLAE